MYRRIFMLVFLGVTCNGDSGPDDWSNRGFYRPRRNYPIQSQTQNSFSTSHSQNSLPFGITQTLPSQNAFRISYNQNQNLQSKAFQTQEPQSRFGTGFTSHSQSSFEAAYNQPTPQNTVNQNPHNQNFTGTASNRTQNVFSTRVNNQRQNTFGVSYNQRPGHNPHNQNYLGTGSSSTTQNIYRTSLNQNSKNSNSPFVLSYSQQLQRQNYFEAQKQTLEHSFGQNLIQYSGNTGFGNNGFKGQNYLPPPLRPPYKAPEYLPPRKDRTTTRQPYFTTTRNRPFTTKRPYTTITTQRYRTTTRKPLYTTTTTKRPFYTTTTSRPYYTPTTRLYPTFTKKPPGAALPAMAMRVPPEPEDEPTTPETTGRVDLAPAMAMKIPPEPEDSPIPITTTTTTTPNPTTTTTTTTQKPTTPSTTTSTTTTPDLNRYITDATLITTPPFQAPGYLPPTLENKTPVTKKPPARVLPAMAMRVPAEPEDEPTTPETTGRVDLAPAMAMKIPPEPEDPPIPITTTTTTTPKPTTTTTTTTTEKPTTPSTTTSTTTTPDLNRYITDPTSTTTPPFQAPGYLPPTLENKIPVTKKPPGRALPAMAMRVPPEPEDEPTTPETTGRVDLEPAMAMKIPPEPEDPPAPITTTTTTTPKPTTTTTTTTTQKPTTPSTTTSTTTTPDLNRYITDPTSTTTPPFQAPGYLPPTLENKTPVTKKPPARVLPAMAMRVPAEPEDEPTTPETTGRVDLAPAMAMKIPPEPEDPPIPITTTTTTTPKPTTTTTTTTTQKPTTPSTTTSTTTTPDLNRYITDPTSTTTPPFQAPGYLPPTLENKIPVTKKPPGRALPAMAMRVPPEPEDEPTTPETTGRVDLEPAMAMKIPPEPEDPPAPITTTTTTTPKPTTTITTQKPTTPSTTTSIGTTSVLNRFLGDPTTTVPHFKAPVYLPPLPTLAVPPKPAMAIPVLPEPDCDSTGHSYLDIDQRYGENPCVPFRKTKPPFVGPSYLPPAPKIRVARSLKTLTLSDLKGVATGHVRPVWHVAIYDKTKRPYQQICGGSIVRNDVVITAAHCVWSDADKRTAPAENFAVAGYKMYKPWTEAMDKKAQKSDVAEISVPVRYQSGQTSYQDDLALLKLVTPFTYKRGLRPLCVSFDDSFEEEQLTDGTNGTIAGFGLTDAVGTPTQLLLWLELPYIDVKTCIDNYPAPFLKYITSDKICAGEFGTGKALCHGDSGGGLVFWYGDPDKAVPYLRGIASAAPHADNQECNVQTASTLTLVSAHRRFLRKHVPDIEHCRYDDWQ